MALSGEIFEGCSAEEEQRDNREKRDERHCDLNRRKSGGGGNRTRKTFLPKADPQRLALGHSITNSAWDDRAERVSSARSLGDAPLIRSYEVAVKDWPGTPCWQGRRDRHGVRAEERRSVPLDAACAMCEGIVSVPRLPAAAGTITSKRSGKETNLDLEGKVALVASHTCGIRNDRGTAVVAIMHVHE